MAIQALPQTTVRALGASQVLTDPASLVKELIDNAIDAAATSVAVEIHNNTLDTIQVRDNGRGIPPEDRPLVARRYCTSKISHDDDLKDIGGSSLGFRGEALASAAELSGSLTISTRIEGEQVAAALKISQKGEVVGQDRASLPVGTTARITDFIKTNPVRRQVALKNTEICLRKIKRLLQAYALARPHIRFSLRVLKAKNTKGDWIYAPKPDCSVEYAAFKVVGSACASQCVWSILEHADFTFQAYLPRPDADASKISNIGSFLSVDGRPVSSARGTPKQLVKVFREALKKASSDFENVKDPFLYLEIACPKGSYDANLEPAKDDVLFEDPSVVVEGARKLFATIYEVAKASVEPFDMSASEQEASSHEPHGHDDLGISGQNVNQVEAGPMKLPNVEPDLRDASPFTDRHFNEANDESSRKDWVAPVPPRGLRSNMYGMDEEDLDMLDSRPPTSHSAENFAELRQARNDVNLSNPFVLAKLHSAVRRPAQQQQDGDDTAAYLSSSPAKTANTRQQGLPTPRPSSPSPSILDCDPPTLPVNPFTPAQLQSPMHSDFGPVYDNGSQMAEQRHTAPAYNYNLGGQALDTPCGTHIDDIPDVSTRPHQKPAKQNRQSQINKPFVQPYRAPVEASEQDRVWFNFDDVEKRQKRPRRGQPNNGLVTQGELGDLEHDPRPLTPPRRNRDIRDFVGRGSAESVAAMVERRNYNNHPAQEDTGDQENEPLPENPRPARATSRNDFVSAAEIAAMQAYCSSPEKPVRQASKRRRTSERPALQELSTNAPVPDEEESTRPITSTRRRSSANLTRRKSSRLPLERVPAGQSVANIVLQHRTSTSQIASAAGKIDSLLRFNEPVINLSSTLSSESLNMHELTVSLHDLLVKSGGDDAGAPAPQQLFEEMRVAFARKGEEVEDGEDELMSFA